MDNFKPIDEVAKEVLNDITRKRVSQLTGRHIAMCLTELEYLKEDEKEIIKKNFRFLESMFLRQILGIKGYENGNETNK